MIYRNNAGDPDSNIPEELALALVDEANTIFEEANTGIRFFVRHVKIENNTFYWGNVRTLTQVNGDLLNGTEKKE